MLTIMAGDGEQLDSLSLESYEIDDESFNSEDSNEEVDVEDSSYTYQGPIQPYMFEPEVDGDLSEGGGDSEPEDETRLQQDVSEW